MSEEGKIADDDAKFYAKQAKQQRQQLKIQCLGLASKNGDPDTDSIVKAAKAFYAFART